MSSESSLPWLLYGAYGFTGRLLAEEAVRRGHRPILAGRDPERVRAIGEELACPVRVFSLDDSDALAAGLEGVRAVLNAAGPFIYTAPPLLAMAIEKGVHYLDITGEVPVFEMVFALDHDARARGVALLPGIGMDVIPTDAVAALLAERLPTADRLDLALRSGGTPSAGTLRTIVHHLKDGLLVRREGKLGRANPGRREFLRRVGFGPGREGGVRPVAPYTWGDLSTAFRTTGIENITCYMARSRREVRLLPWVLPVLRLLFALGPVRRIAERRIAAGPPGPDAETRKTARTRVWGRVRDAEGRSASIGLETMEGYRFTGEAGVRALEALLARPALVGALTPARAFGARWVLDLPETRLVETEAEA
ncbi:MAG: saccharopine dehydrogenase [Gemmatimonadales bacterium]|nr:MAG: saccharopine dehydrogenase [Gemmatimonadales bacterium]